MEKINTINNNIIMEENNIIIKENNIIIKENNTNDADNILNLDTVINKIMSHEDPKCSVDKLVELIFPEETRYQRDQILWGKTGYPGFFKPKEGQTNQQVLLEQLLEYRDNLVNKKDKCARCGKIFDVSKIENYDYFDMEICEECKVDMANE